jgi:amino acid permease
MPKVVRNVFWRILLFYLLSILIIGLNVPYDYPGLSDTLGIVFAGLLVSPAVMAMDSVPPLFGC